MNDKLPVYAENESMSNTGRLGMYYFFCDEIHEDGKTIPYGEIILKVSTIQILNISIEIIDHEKIGTEEAYGEAFLRLIENISSQFNINHIDYSYENTKTSFKKSAPN